MSTILKTLKKLEEEKSVLEKNIDLKGLLLQGHDTVYPQKEEPVPRKWGWVAGFLLAGGVLGAIAVYFFQPASQPAPGIQKAHLPPSPPPAQEVKPKQVRPPSATGIPLAYIPDRFPADYDPYWEGEDFEPYEVYTPPAAAAPEVKRQEPPMDLVPPEVEEINSLIKTVTSAARRDNPRSLKNSAVQNGYIPGIRVKGIIFFGPGNPANHIYVSTPTDKNRKVKAGESVLNASLESIEAQNAVFAYMGQKIAIGIGE